MTKYFFGESKFFIFPHSATENSSIQYFVKIVTVMSAQCGYYGNYLSYIFDKNFMKAEVDFTKYFLSEREFPVLPRWSDSSAWKMFHKNYNLKISINRAISRDFCEKIMKVNLCNFYIHTLWKGRFFHKYWTQFHEKSW